MKRGPKTYLQLQPNAIWCHQRDQNGDLWDCHFNLANFMIPCIVIRRNALLIITWKTWYYMSGGNKTKLAREIGVLMRVYKWGSIALQAGSVHRHTYTLTHTHLPAGPPGSGMIQDVGPGARGRNWSYGAAPGSRIYTKRYTKNLVRK